MNNLINKVLDLLYQEEWANWVTRIWCYNISRKSFELWLKHYIETWNYRAHKDELDKNDVITFERAIKRETFWNIYSFYSEGKIEKINFFVSQYKNEIKYRETYEYSRKNANNFLTKYNMKETFYFPHDNNAHNDPKLMSVFMEVWLSWIWLYWVIIELLHQQDTGIITEQQFNNYVKFYTWWTNVEQMLNILKTSWLFCIEDWNIFSKRVLENKNFREDLREKRRLAGIESAKKRAWNKEESTSVEQNLTNAQQGKERKGNKKENKEIIESDKSLTLENLIKENIDIEYYKNEYNWTHEYIYEELKKFYLYWSEKKPWWKKERWQMEKTYDVWRRFHKWLSNNFWNKPKEGQKMVIVDF